MDTNAALYSVGIGIYVIKTFAKQITPSLLISFSGQFKRDIWPLLYTRGSRFIAADFSGWIFRYFINIGSRTRFFRRHSVVAQRRNNRNNRRANCRRINVKNVCNNFGYLAVDGSIIIRLDRLSRSGNGDVALHLYLITTRDTSGPFIIYVLNALPVIAHRVRCENIHR